MMTSWYGPTFNITGYFVRGNHLSVDGWIPANVGVARVFVRVRVRVRGGGGGWVTIFVIFSMNKI